MYMCEKCGANFDEPDTRTYDCEAYAGVGSMFSNHHYSEYEVCPECGSSHIIEYGCDEDCRECPHYHLCTLDIKVNFPEDSDLPEDSVFPEDSEGDF